MLNAADSYAAHLEINPYAIAARPSQNVGSAVLPAGAGNHEVLRCEQGYESTAE